MLVDAALADPEIAAMFGFGPDLMKQPEDSSLITTFNNIPRSRTGVSNETELFKVESQVSRQDKHRLSRSYEEDIIIKELNLDEYNSENEKNTGSQFQTRMEKSVMTKIFSEDFKTAKGSHSLTNEVHSVDKEWVE